MLSFSDPLPHTPQRVLIAGVTGVGKSTLGKHLSELWEIPYTNLDVLHWGPGWTERPQFREEAHALAASDHWITEWQYWGKGLKHTLGNRAETIIWLNFPRPLAWQRLFRRTVRRWATQHQAFAGCTERPPWTAFTDENHILRWEAKTHSKWRERMPALVQELSGAAFIELRSPHEVRNWLSGPAQQAREL
ncbi:AAA family ATPase [Nesterenkonia alkaliphila]|uniref:AAA family ATPase n=1 Tax=Nesterenkonia alkaliphila TaxID=1463631 RepID=A0A7K1UEY4_9MICC|nr:AAA family ATPase [Nesterenkonia alkaliphila]MVT25035.1 AAA family ATPase [Nesterenkonia alkaliphila]GFZ97927.1 adenylate kinase [Nesterenkonia alkaliphila]